MTDTDTSTTTTPRKSLKTWLDDALDYFLSGGGVTVLEVDGKTILTGVNSWTRSKGATALVFDSSDNLLWAEMASVEELAKFLGCAIEELPDHDVSDIDADGVVNIRRVASITLADGSQIDL